MTSQALLHSTHEEFEGIQLDVISTADSINLLLFGSIFSKKTANSGPPLVDSVLAGMCKVAGVAYLEPALKEKPKESEKRRRNMTELLRPDFIAFLEKELGNLPLSISMVGQMIRSDATITSTLDLIKMFRNVQLDKVWTEKARNRQTDKHYFGLAMSVKITLDRLDTNAEFSADERRCAKTLLVAMSMLDRTKTPLSLLQNHDAVKLTANCRLPVSLVSYIQADCLPPQTRMAIVGASDASTKSPCHFFQIGTCRAGDSCRFSHDSQTQQQQAAGAPGASATPSMCRFFVSGTCRGWILHNAAVVLPQFCGPPPPPPQDVDKPNDRMFYFCNLLSTTFLSLLPLLLFCVYM
jgi:hypothetical protein